MSNKDQPEYVVVSKEEEGEKAQEQEPMLRNSSGKKDNSASIRINEFGHFQHTTVYQNSRLRFIHPPCYQLKVAPITGLCYYT